VYRGELDRELDQLRAVHVGFTVEKGVDHREPALRLPLARCVDREVVNDGWDIDPHTPSVAPAAGAGTSTRERAAQTRRTSRPIACIDLRAAERGARSPSACPESVAASHARGSHPMVNTVSTPAKRLSASAIAWRGWSPATAARTRFTTTTRGVTSSGATESS